jgi:hypothetical protein
VAIEEGRGTDHVGEQDRDERTVHALAASSPLATHASSRRVMELDAVHPRG